MSKKKKVFGYANGIRKKMRKSNLSLEEISYITLAELVQEYCEYTDPKDGFACILSDVREIAHEMGYNLVIMDETTTIH